MNMPAIIPQSPDLTKLAIEINALNEQTETAKHQALIYAARTGAKLKQAKASIEHGQFIVWLNENCTISRQYANSYMRLADEYPQLLESNVNSTLHLPSITHAIALMTATEDVKNDVMLRLENGEKITVEQIKELKHRTETQQKLLATSEQVMKNFREEIAKKEKELEDLIAEGGIDKLIAEKTAENEVIIEEMLDRQNDLSDQISRLKNEQAQAIERGVQIELNKKQRELARLDEQTRLANSELETLQSKIKQKQSLEAFNSQYQQAAAQLLEKLLAMDLLINTADDSKNRLFEHKTLKILDETVKKCYDLAEKIDGFRLLKQTQLDEWQDMTFDEPAELIYYFTEFNKEKGNVITDKFKNGKTKKDGLEKFLKAIKKVKVNEVIVTGYASPRDLNVGDTYHMQTGDKRYSNGEFYA